MRYLWLAINFKNGFLYRIFVNNLGLTPSNEDFSLKQGKIIISSTFYG
jgi:hypothetical protein